MTVASRPEILAFVRDYWQEWGYAPSMRDVRDGLGFSSTSVVRYKLVRLRMDGLVEFDSKRARTLRVREVVAEISGVVSD